MTILSMDGINLFSITNGSQLYLSLVRRLTFVTGVISSILPRVQLRVYTPSSGSLIGNRHWLGSIFRGAYIEQPMND